MPELPCMDRPGWRGLSRGMDELLEVMAKHKLLRFIKKAKKNAHNLGY